MKKVNDPDWGRECPHCAEKQDTHRYLENEWICFVCVGVWPHVDS